MSPKFDSADTRPPDRPDPIRRTPAPFDDPFVTEWSLVPAGLDSADGATAVDPAPSRPAYPGVE